MLLGTTRGTTFDTTFVPHHVRLNSRTAKFVLALVRHSMNFNWFCILVAPGIYDIYDIYDIIAAAARPS
jgi:hypothetical protein